MNTRAVMAVLGAPNSSSGLEGALLTSTPTSLSGLSSPTICRTPRSSAFFSTVKKSRVGGFCTPSKS